MNPKQMDKEIDATLASLGGVRPCLASETFAQQVLASVAKSDKETNLMSWQANLVIAVAVMLIFLNGVALTWTWKVKATQTRTKILWVIAFEGRDTTPSFFQGNADEIAGGF